MNLTEPRIFSGSANPIFTEKILNYLGLSQGEIDIKKFKDGEIWVKYKENIRGRDVYIVQPTQPPAENLMELLMMIDAAKRASAKRVTAVIPYFGYARQDRKDQPRVSITAKMVANLITVAGAERVITMDLHAAQIQGFFDIPLDHLYGSGIFTSLFSKRNENLVVVSADMGGVKLARSYASRLDAGLAIIDKRRPKANIAEVMNIIGDVKGKVCIVTDDLIDTAGTLCNAAGALKDAGAAGVKAYITHPVLSGPAIERISNSSIDELVVTNSIPLSQDGEKCSKIRVISLAPTIAECIRRLSNEESLSAMFT